VTAGAGVAAGCGAATGGGTGAEAGGWAEDFSRFNWRRISSGIG